MDIKDILVKLSAPSNRALENANINTLEELLNWNEKELLKLHGFGPKSIRIINEILSKDGISLKK